MRKRPRASVTTTLANFVGRSVVSAITQTPASGPLGLLTTPPMSPAAALPAPCVLRHAVRRAGRTAAAMPRYKVLLVFMKSPFWMRASGCTFPSASASRERPRRTGRPSVQCADAQPRARDGRIFRRELFHQTLPGRDRYSEDFSTRPDRLRARLG